MNIRPFTARSTPYSLETSVHGSLALDPAHRIRWDQEVAEILQMRLPPQVAYDRWIHGFARSVVEIACGIRPVAQVRTHTTARVYDDLARRAQLVARAVAQPVGQPLLQAVKPQVVSMHTYWLDPTVAEVALRVRYGERCRAVALRVEQRDSRWRATALEFA
jgi:hypothetical protein